MALMDGSSAVIWGLVLPHAVVWGQLGPAPGPLGARCLALTGTRRCGCRELLVRFTNAGFNIFRKHPGVKVMQVQRLRRRVSIWPAFCRALPSTKPVFAVPRRASPRRRPMHRRLIGALSTVVYPNLACPRTAKDLWAGWGSVARRCSGTRSLTSGSGTA